MTINFMTGNVTAAGEKGRGAWRGRRWLTVPGVVGVGYPLSWIAGLSIAAPSPSFGAILRGTGCVVMRAPRSSPP